MSFRCYVTFILVWRLKDLYVVLNIGNLEITKKGLVIRSEDELQGRDFQSVLRNTNNQLP